MSYAIGNRIRELRTVHHVGQEEMASALGTTRQRYARMENGQVDISYVTIKVIADYFGVPTREITSVMDEHKELVAFFREKQVSKEMLESVACIEDILKTFNAHQKLYFQMKASHEHDD